MQGSSNGQYELQLYQESFVGLFSRRPNGLVLGSERRNVNDAKYALVAYEVIVYELICHRSDWQL